MDANKSIAYAITGAVLLISISLIYAALIEQGLILQPAGSRQKGNVITTSSGHVKLGNIYSESKMVDITLSVRNRNGEFEELLSLKGVNPWSHSSTISDELQESIINNAARLGYRVQTRLRHSIDNVTLPDDGILQVTTYVRYQSEYQPDFTFQIAAKEFAVPTNVAVKNFTLQKVNAVIAGSRKAWKKSMFLSGDND